MIKNVFITGVGGQGILTVSTIISDAALACGFDAKKSEVHGMAQRGGSVVSHVRYGDKIHSTIIDKGQADVLISFEKLEALRYMDFLKKEGTMIVNDQKIVPAILGEPVPYPENAEDIFKEKIKHVLFFPAIKTAEELGNARTTNIILLGAFANFAPEISTEVWKKAIANKFPEKFHDINFKAFDKGMELAKGVLAMIRSIDELLKKAEELPSKKVAIAAAHDDAAIEAAVEAKEKNIADAVLIGIKSEIESKLEKLDAPKDLFEIINKEDDGEAVAEAVRLIRAGEAHVLLKGKVKTGTLIKGVLNKEAGLRTGRLLSDIFIFDCPMNGENRLMGITDGGLNLAPDVEQKAQIITNAVEAFHRLGYSEPKVAVLSAVEVINPDLQSTVDAAELTKMNKSGELEGCIVDGPLAMDLALSEEAARIKGFESPVAGKADILVFPNIESANITAKAIMYMIPFEPSHVIVGATAPVLIPSRSDSSEAKLNALAFGCIAAHK